MKHSILLCSLLLAAGTVKAQTTTPITSVDELSETNNRILYHIMTKNAAENAHRGALYAQPDNNFLASIGATYPNYGSYTKANGSIIDATDTRQQFAFITYNGKKYLYSVAAEKFAYKDGNKAPPLQTTPQK